MSFIHFFISSLALISAPHSTHLITLGSSRDCKEQRRNEWGYGGYCPRSPTIHPPNPPPSSHLQYPPYPHGFLCHLRSVVTRVTVVERVRDMMVILPVPYLPTHPTPPKEENNHHILIPYGSPSLRSVSRRNERE